MKVKAVDGLGESKEYDLNDGFDKDQQSKFVLWVGRAKSCYIVVDDMSVSREHAQVSYVDSKWFIKSDKRMLVNGLLKSESEIRDGDIITLGSCSLNVYDGGVPEKKDESDVEGENEADMVEEEGTQSDYGSDENEPSEDIDGEEEYQEEASEFGEEMVEVEDGDKTEVVKGFSKVELDIFGEYASYDTYVVEKKEIFIGRDPEKCDIVLSDPEVSGVHAVIKKSLIELILEDMNSGNGTLLNGERINKKSLNSGDEFVIGSTTFGVRIESDFIEDERLHMMPVDENQFVEVEEEVEFEEDEMEEGQDDDSDKSLVGKLMGLLSKDALKNPKKRKKIIYIVMGVLVVWILFDNPEKESKVTSKKNKKAKEVKKKEIKLRPEVLVAIDSSYQLSLELFETGKYKEAIFELDKIFLKVSDYKKSKALYQASKDALRELELMKKKERELKELAERKIKVKKLLKKAEDAVKERRAGFAEQLFAQIAQLDPENVDIIQLKVELEHYKKEEERKKVEKAAKEAERRRQEMAIVPGKKFYSQKKWHAAIEELGILLEKEKQMDKDLLDEVNEMLADAKEQLNNIIDPILAKAKSMMDGKDLKGAYESYLEILIHDPGNIEALNKMNGIKEKLRLQSRKVYREAIISESLSLFEQAKEKFQEVQQISPIDSEYYKKSTDKLKKYLE